MASRSLIRPAFVCANCRYKLLATSSFIQTPPPRQQQQQQQQKILRKHGYSRAGRQPLQARSFHCTSATLAGDPTDKTDAPVDWSRLTDLERLEASFEDKASSKLQNAQKPQTQTQSWAEPAGNNQVAAVPWYLQDQSHQQDHVNPLLDRQRIPDLPNNPPPIVEPLLHHLSVDLGLDYLSLLDLRDIYPPPALGANLVMVIGSARSQKHLNVSADRLCRWLRSNYKLRPVADGLLGRNEIKLKIKRKNKKAKLMSAAGAVYNPDPDDGISTGWICVDVGSVENGPHSSKSVTDVSETPGFVGFGPTSERAKIFIQIMTEDRRNQLDLEALWQSTLNTSTRRLEGTRREQEKQLALPNQNEPENSDLGQDVSTAGPAYPRNKAKVNTTFQQARSFHAKSPFRSSGNDNAAQGKDSQSGPGQVIIHYTAEPRENQGKPNAASPDIRRSASRKTSLVKDSKSSATLRHELNWLKSQNEDQALSLLTRNEQNMTPTSFYSRFFRSFPTVPLPEHLLIKLELHMYAVKIGQSQYTVSGLLTLLRELQACAMCIPEHAFTAGFEAILFAPLDLRSPPVHKEQRMSAMNKKLDDAFHVLELMEAHGYDARSNQIFIILHNAIVRLSDDSPDNNNPSPNIHYHLSDNIPQDAAAPEAGSGNKRRPTAPILKLGPKQQKFYSYLFSRALEEIYVPQSPTDNSLYLHLMRSYLYSDPPAWNVFWRLWHHLARIMHRRVPEMYALVFKTVAEKSHGSRCQNDLMLLYSEMSREDPPVECTQDVAGALMQCLVKADVARDGRPWDTMWATAENGLYRRL